MNTTVRTHRAQLSRGLSPTLLSTAIRWELYRRYGWMSHAW